MTSTISLQDGDRMLNNIIIDCINNLDFEIDNFLNNQDDWDDLEQYLIDVFDECFFEYLHKEFPFFYECMKAFEIYVLFYDAEIKDGKLCFRVNTGSKSSRTWEMYQIVSEKFEIEVEN